MDSAISQLTISAIIVWLIDKLKGASWFPVLTPQSSERFKQVVGGIAATVASLGITYHYDPTLGVLTIGGLTLASIGNFAWVWAQNFVTQQVLYHGVAKNGSSPSNPQPHS